MNVNNPRLPKIDEIIIWDSNFGYDLVQFKGLSPAGYYYAVISLTGNYSLEKMAVDKNQVKKYSDELIDELTIKYGYKHDKDRIN